MLCAHRHVFGKEGEGVHRHRLFGIAVVDAVLTIALGLLIARWTGWHVLPTLLGLFLLAIIAHRLFCVNTTVNKAIFGVV
jgi:polyferredoxin